MQVVAFIKGTKQLPMCGFSNTVVQILNAMGVPYVTVNILEDDLLRSGGRLGLHACTAYAHAVLLCVTT